MKQDEIKRLQELADQEAIKVSEADKLRARCDHSYPDGKSALNPIDRGRNLFRCNICKKAINLSTIPADAMKNSTQTIIDAIQAIKIGHPSLGATTREQIGQLSVVIEQLPDLYAKATVNDVNANDYRNRGNRINSMPQGMQQLFGSGGGQMNNNMKQAGRGGNRHI